MAENNKINAEELEEVTGGTSALFNDTIDTKPEKKAQGKTVQPLVKGQSCASVPRNAQKIT